MAPPRKKAAPSAPTDSDLPARATAAAQRVSAWLQAQPRIEPVKWHTGWIPIAEDGCGNLYCVDLAPGPAGRVGQVIKWENAGGPFASSSTDLAELLERYATALESGRHRYESDSGTYDGPFVDLLAPPGRRR
jgi:cell wall assembly regulator SMI1